MESAAGEKITKASGGCLCGAVTFQASQVEPHVHACHCSMCRRWTGGPMQAAAVGELQFTSGQDAVKSYASSEWAERGFCGECGTTLFYKLSEPGMFMLATGSFDNPELFALGGEIYVDEKPSGCNFAGDHPRLTGAEFMASMGLAPDGTPLS